MKLINVFSIFRVDMHAPHAYSFIRNIHLSAYVILFIYRNIDDIGESEHINMIEFKIMLI